MKGHDDLRIVMMMVMVGADVQSVRESFVS